MKEKTNLKNNSQTHLNMVFFQPCAYLVFLITSFPTHALKGVFMGFFSGCLLSSVSAVMLSNNKKDTFAQCSILVQWLEVSESVTLPTILIKELYFWVHLCSSAQ